ncbi:hypothetical protein B0T17DRAFT_503001 [Bombardia bombarda]|uniref:Uncharacterized protein n=1 Tax=Bombardia bombarda TaxID=252184 RepID=A0AA39XKR5_9PEZI|nr:hypothetical protein B0T17DRAFT_503001 [Bombardia bombarda]
MSKHGYSIRSGMTLEKTAHQYSDNKSKVRDIQALVVDSRKTPSHAKMTPSDRSFPLLVSVAIGARVLKTVAFSSTLSSKMILARLKSVVLSASRGAVDLETQRTEEAGLRQFDAQIADSNRSPTYQASSDETTEKGTTTLVPFHGSLSLLPKIAARAVGLGCLGLLAGTAKQGLGSMVGQTTMFVVGH